jgi:hypothetical protein
LTFFFFCFLLFQQVAEGSNDDALHVRLEIERAHIRDIEGWEAYDFERKFRF